MGPKKAQKVQSRWTPLPERASIMQVTVIPEVDMHFFRPDDLTKEELLNCTKYIEQSNRTLEVENIIIQNYLNRTDAKALEKMSHILEAAAVALQKAERAHLGPGASTLSIPRDGFPSRMTEESDSFSRPGTAKSSSVAARLGVFALAEKGPKVQASQKIEIVNRELDELKSTLESFRKKARNYNYILRCRNEEMTERLQEITENQNNFDQKLLVEGVDQLTGKLPGEKFIRYLEMRLKTEEIEIDRMRIKTGSLKSHLKRVQQQLAQKEELGEILHPVDFEQLQMENRECQERLDERIAHVIDIKKINGKFGNLLNVNKKKLNEQKNKLASLEENVIVKEKMVKQMTADEEKVNSEVAVVEKGIAKIVKLMNSYTVPEVIEYINKKAEVLDLKKEIKVCERQVKLKDLALATQLHKIKSMQVDSSKSQTFGGFGLGSRTGFTKESRMFF